MSFDTLFPACPTCGAVDGIETAVLGPESPDGFHDVTTLRLECGHELDAGDVDGGPDRISSDVVDLVRLSNPEAIELDANV